MCAHWIMSLDDPSKEDIQHEGRDFVDEILLEISSCLIT